MNYGLYLAASGALDAVRRQEVLTNNLVNSETIGFKPDMVFGRQRLPARLEPGGAAAGIDPQLLLERLGGSPMSCGPPSGASRPTGSSGVTTGARAGSPIPRPCTRDG